MTARVTSILALGAGLAALAGCTADVPDVDGRVYFCEADDECGPGWLCTESNVVSRDFCAAECDPGDASSCAGFCTSEGRCLPSCEIHTDGTTTLCPDGMDCLRLSSKADASGSDPGICYPADSCTVDEDCEAAGFECPLAESLPPSIMGTLRFDHYYCVPQAEGDRCPSGWIVARFGSGPSARNVCVPTCGDPEVPGGTIRCPPATACLAHAAPYFDDPTVAPCVPGYWGMPCRDQTNCLVGECTLLPDGRRNCVDTCEYADTFAAALGLPDLPDPCMIFTAILGSTSFRCETGLCVGYQRALSTCDATAPCLEGYECRELMFPGSRMFDGCVRACTVDADCNDPTGAWCLVDPDTGPPGFCYPKLGDGEMCTEPRQCASGLCTGGFCMRRT